MRTVAAIEFFRKSFRIRSCHLPKREARTKTRTQVGAIDLEMFASHGGNLVSKYREEIDGLRAIAVMSVLFCHTGLPLFSGGYVGVDLFFVISGYVIFGIILDDVEKDKFSLYLFYERRARRILPACFLVMAVCIPLGWVFMSADAFKNFGQSIVATTFFANNILLDLTSGYWDMESKFKPLLHTWSLGVEEQFYVFAPFLIILAYKRFDKRVYPIVFAVGVLSFLYCLACVEYKPVANFYLLPTRAWELTAGAIAMLFLRHRASVPSSDFLASVGLALIVIAVAGFPDALPSPSIYTTVPVLGASLILVYCRRGYTYQILTQRPVVGIGLISYSTYLWHQPLFAFLRVINPERPPVLQFCLLIPVELFLAYFSWRYVEQPFRNREEMQMRKVAWILGPAAIVLAIVGAGFHLGGGLPYRFPVAAGAEQAGAYKIYNSSVFSYKKEAFTSDQTHRILVLGNSTGRDFVNIVNESHQFYEYEIVYRDDLRLCDYDEIDTKMQALIKSATLIVSVYNHLYVPICDGRALAMRPEFREKLVFVGPKDFGVNINPVSRLPLNLRPAAAVALSDEVLEANARYRELSPPNLYIDVIAHLSSDGRTVPIFDEDGRILSEDRVHVTRAGAAFIGRRIFTDTIWNDVKRASECCAMPHAN